MVVFRNQTKRKRVKSDKCQFTNTEFSSDNGFQVSVWGPSVWHALHTKSFNYPIHPTRKQKRCYRLDVENMRNTLPCGKCRKNLIANMKSLPLLDKHLESRDSFSRYIYNLHEAVNTMLGKKSGLTYEAVRERYENFRARCNKTEKKKKEVVVKKEHGGCTEPKYKGKGAKCLLRIVPTESNEETFKLDERCVKQRLE